MTQKVDKPPSLGYNLTNYINLIDQYRLSLFENLLIIRRVVMSVKVAINGFGRIGRLVLSGWI